MEYYSAMKRMKLFCSNMDATKVIILSEVVQKEKDKYHVSQRNYPQNRNRLTDREHTCGCQARAFRIGSSGLTGLIV